MLNLHKAKQRFAELKDVEVPNEPSTYRTRQLVEWVRETIPVLLEAADTGLQLSRLAASSELRNQPPFLTMLFDQVVRLQSIVTDSRAVMQRERPDVAGN